MRFFNDFFDQYLFPDNNFIPQTDLYTAINRQQSLPALLDTLGKDTILRNEVLREMVCLKSMQSLYFQPKFSKMAILKILQDLKNTSKFSEHREIAQNLMDGLTRFEKGHFPPEFVLPDLDGDLHKLEEYYGKPTYICFFTTWSYGCLTELELMRDLYDRYKGKVHFLGISLDQNADIVRQLKMEKNYAWDFMFNGTDYPLILNYRIKTFPVFLLLDAAGKVVEYPAYKPSEIIHEQFDRLLKQG
jgi:cytochrome oxidase Cu insertion factor (SCO1/SenC/PrrC family)